MIGTLALEMMATTSVRYADRMARANSARSLALFDTVRRFVVTTKSMSLDLVSYHFRLEALQSQVPPIGGCLEVTTHPDGKYIWVTQDPNGWTSASGQVLFTVRDMSSMMNRRTSYSARVGDMYR